MHSLPLLAVTWQPFLRGIIVVLIGFTVLCGSVYLLLATNLGARLGMLVALAGLFGWIAFMATVWWAYGIGLKGKDPTWKPVLTAVGSEIVNARSGSINGISVAPDGTISGAGWTKLASDNAGYGQAVASSDEILLNVTKQFKTGDYVSEAVYSKGGSRYPKIGKFDFLAFKHAPHYSIVQVRPTVKIATEPGKAPPKATADTTQPARYVLMIRDLGNRRRPAAFIAIGASLIFAALCYWLHARDRRVQYNRSGGALEPVPTGV
jgi:hypothetical protein